MQVVFNATSLLSPLTGIGQYTYHLANGLMNIPGVMLKFFYGTKWGYELRDQPIPHIKSVKTLIKVSVPYYYWFARTYQQHVFNQGIKAKDSSLYHEPNFLAFRYNGPSIITVHDLSWIRYPETHPIARVRTMNKYFEPGLRRAKLILTDSEFIKRELIDVFAIPETKIKAVALGVDHWFYPRAAEETNAILARYGLTHGRYLLSVATLEPRKNILATLEAYMQLKPSVRQTCPLVITGMSGWNNDELHKKLLPLLQAGEIRQIPYLPRNELAILVSGALSMVYPSLYEGFGLPPLEAMTSAVPVISSNVSSLPEVVGDTGLLVDPHDTSAITESMQQLILDADLRDVLAKKSLERSKLFSWKNCVHHTVDAYREVISG